MAEPADSTARSWSRRRLLVAALGLLAFTPPGALGAHEVPANVAVQVYVRPEGNRLRLLVRAPAEAMRDIVWPLRGPGYLDFARLGGQARDAAQLWIANYLTLYEDDRELPDETVVAARLSLPSDRSFVTWGSALASVLGPPLPAETEIVWNQAFVDALLEIPIADPDARFSIDPQLAHLGITTVSVLHFITPAGVERVFQYEGNPGMVRLDPRWHQAAFRFVALGFRHILGGFDHLLFVLCLVVPIRRLRPLVAVVTSFTVAHSITLIASALGLAPNALWFPPLIEMLIAASIVYMALENIVGARLERRWIMAFAFGLVHGFGFSFALRESLQFAGSHLLSSLLAFNAGVELGQLVVIAVAVPALAAMFRWVVAERIGSVIVSVVLAHSAWHWMADRFSAVRQYPLSWPALDATLLAALLRGLMLLLIVGGVAWLVSGVLSRLAGTGEVRPGETGPERRSWRNA